MSGAGPSWWRRRSRRTPRRRAAASARARGSVRRPFAARAPAAHRWRTPGTRPQPEAGHRRSVRGPFLLAWWRSTGAAKTLRPVSTSAHERDRMTHDVLLFATVFLACAVEAVEAVTIVLAAGITRGWRSALVGTGAALVLLAAIVAVLGPALTSLPLNALRLVVGGLLLVFGLQWLRKAVLRASGFKPTHDEDAIFAEQLAAARAAGREPRAIDPYGFTLSFKGVLLEGLEVAFIAITFGSNQDNVGLAALAAVIAIAVVAVAGALAPAPLSRVPENTLKYAVGTMLCAFGCFWGAEGAGVEWPTGDAAILGLIGFMLATSAALVALLRRKREVVAA